MRINAQHLEALTLDLTFRSHEAFRQKQQQAGTYVFNRDNCFIIFCRTRPKFRLCSSPLARVTWRLAQHIRKYSCRNDM